MDYINGWNSIRLASRGGGRPLPGHLVFFQIQHRREGGSTTAAPTPWTFTATNHNGQVRLTLLADLGIATFDQSPTPLAKAQVIEASIESIPAWVNRETVK